MKPVRFETDCRACHPLDYDPDHPAIRHPIQPAEVVDALWQAYSAQFLNDHPRLDVAPAGPRPRGPCPRSARRGRRSGSRSRRRKRSSSAGSGAGNATTFEDGRPQGRKVATDPGPLAARPGRAGERPGGLVPSRRLRPLRPRRGRLPRMPRPRLPRRPQRLAGERGRDAADDRRLPDMPLARARRRRTQSRGGAGFDCTECHRYHDAGGTGPHLAEVDPGLKQFLLGVRPKGGK